jgi:hypothetical protein
MSCKNCTSGSERAFNAELTMSHQELRNVAEAPVYFGQHIKVCLDCGHTELTIPPTQLEKLKHDAPEEKRRGKCAKGIAAGG